MKIRVELHQKKTNKSELYIMTLTSTQQYFDTDLYQVISAKPFNNGDKFEPDLVKNFDFFENLFNCKVIRQEQFD